MGKVRHQTQFVSTCSYFQTSKCRFKLRKTRDFVIGCKRATSSWLCQIFPHFNSSEKCGTKWRSEETLDFMARAGHDSNFREQALSTHIDSDWFLSLVKQSSEKFQKSSNQATKRKEVDHIPWVWGSVPRYNRKPTFYKDWQSNLIEPQDK